MPSGRTHAVLNLALTQATTFSMLALQTDKHVSLEVLLGQITGFLVNPDLDLSENRRRPNLWEMFWLPYGLLFNHRGVSHLPILGTLTRLIYMTPLIWLVYQAFPFSVESFLNFSLGLVMSDILHSLADVISTSFKRNFKSPTRRKTAGGFQRISNQKILFDENGNAYVIMNDKKPNRRTKTKRKPTRRFGRRPTTRRKSFWKI